MESIAENEKTDITVDGLCVSYGDKLVLNRLSVRFRAGAFTFVLGPSGCGKTTLLNVLMGINRGFTGEVSGVPALMSAVFQEDRLQDDLSACANLALFCGISRQRVQDELALLALSREDVRKPAGQLSGGMKRRVAIARAMAAKSDVVFLDEPFKGLDEATKLLTMGYVRDRAKGRTVIAVTHDESEADFFGADRVFLSPAAKDPS